MSKAIALRVAAAILASVFLFPGHGLAQSKSAHFDSSNTGGRLYGDLTRTGDEFVFSGIFDVAADHPRATRIQLFLYLYKNKKIIQTIYAPLKGNNGHYVIENLKFEAKSPFDNIGWKVQYNYRLD